MIIPISQPQNKKGGEKGRANTLAFHALLIANISCHIIAIWPLQQLGHIHFHQMSW